MNDNQRNSSRSSNFIFPVELSLYEVRIAHMRSQNITFLRRDLVGNDAYFDAPVMIVNTKRNGRVSKLGNLPIINSIKWRLACLQTNVSTFGTDILPA